MDFCSEACNVVTEPYLAMTWRRARAFSERVLLVAFGVMLSLAIAEACLQIAAVYLRLMGRQASFSPPGMAHRILALGDSNTYGLYLERSQAYPQLLQERWNRIRPAQKIEVANLGFPGTNSSQLRNRVCGFLTAARPDLVTIMIGANDFWTLPEPLVREPALGRSFELLAWKISRLYRLLYMLRRSLDHHQTNVRPPEVHVDNSQGIETGRGWIRMGDATFEMGWSLTPVPGWTPRLEENLNAILMEVRRRGSKPVLLTYPSSAESYGGANRVIRRVGVATGTPVVDLAKVFEHRCPAGECAELFSDQHPTAAGHDLVAETLLETLGPYARAVGSGSDLREPEFATTTR
jgi:lysophospholipase L1-like esterase